MKFSLNSTSLVLCFWIFFNNASHATPECGIEVFFRPTKTYKSFWMPDFTVYAENADPYFKVLRSVTTVDQQMYLIEITEKPRGSKQISYIFPGVPSIGSFPSASGSGWDGSAFFGFSTDAVGSSVSIICRDLDEPKCINRRADCIRSPLDTPCNPSTPDIRCFPPR